MSVTIKKVNEEEMQEYMQALADRTKEGVAFTAASDAFDLYVMIIEQREMEYIFRVLIRNS